MVRAHHSLDIYNVELFLATTRRDWATLRRKVSFLDKSPGENAGLVCFSHWKPSKGLAVPHLVFWVDVALHGDEGELVDTIAHEAAHAAGRILDDVNHTPPGGTDEPSAYLIGWLTRWLWMHCRES